MVDDTFQRLVEDNRRLHRELTEIRATVGMLIAYHRARNHRPWSTTHMLALMDALAEAVDGH